jgi:2-dehydropantoate 2-reductase
MLIYGGGAVGLGIASCLLKAGQSVKILARPETVQRLEHEGLFRTGIFGDAWAAPDLFQTISSLDGLTQEEVLDYVLVATKSFDSEPAARDLADHPHLLADGGVIVLFQNGWGNAEIFARHFDPGIVYNARVITGFTRPQPNHVEVTVHADLIRVGSLRSLDIKPVRPLCEAISAGDIPCRPTAEIAKALWAKMLFNCALNGLGAVFGVTYGTLGESPHTRAIMDAIIGEIFDVMHAAGYSTHWPTAEDYLARFYADEVQLTARHYPSTLQDLRAGKRTEIDAMNGAVVRLGVAHAVPAPVNAAVYHMIKFLERTG